MDNLTKTDRFYYNCLPALNMKQISKNISCAISGIAIFIKRILSFLIVGSVFFVSIPSFASDEWHLQIDDRANDIILHHRKTTNNLIEFRGITHIKSSLSAFVALLRDIESMPNWVDRAHKATKLIQISDTENYTHMITSMPFPFTYRHSIVHTQIYQDPLSGDIAVNGRNAKPGSLHKLSREKKEFLAHQKKKYILTQDLKSHWIFRPQADGMVEVEFQGHGNPGGNLSKYIPQRILRMFAWEAPYNTLKGMRKIILNKKYQSSRFSFIKEPIQKQKREITN